MLLRIRSVRWKLYIMSKDWMQDMFQRCSILLVMPQNFYALLRVMLSLYWTTLRNMYIRMPEMSTRIWFRFWSMPALQQYSLLTLPIISIQLRTMCSPMGGRCRFMRALLNWLFDVSSNQLHQMLQLHTGILPIKLSMHHLPKFMHTVLKWNCMWGMLRWVLCQSCRLMYCMSFILLHMRSIFWV